MREPVFSITEKDLEVQTFKSGGPGGQNQNKRETGVRIIHKESGAIGEARDSRSQLENKRNALKRLSKSHKFKLWSIRRIMEIDGGKTLEQVLDALMKPENLKIEVQDEEGNWVEE